MKARRSGLRYQETLLVCSLDFLKFPSSTEEPMEHGTHVQTYTTSESAV